METEFKSDLCSQKLHSDGWPCACPHSGCTFEAKSKGNLSKHTTTVHCESKTFTGSKCCLKTNSAMFLASHTIVHEGRNEKVPCSIEGCGYKGKNTRALKKHMSRHKTHLPCPVPGCGRYLFTKQAFKNHALLHNPSARAFQCPLCFKHYRNLHALQNHCAVHTDEKPFQCGHCDYAARSQYNVKVHISTAHAAVEFPFVVHLLDDRECVRCKVTLPSADFVAHSESHASQGVRN